MPHPKLHALQIRNAYRGRPSAAASEALRYMLLLAEELRSELPQGATQAREALGLVEELRHVRAELDHETESRSPAA